MGFSWIFWFWDTGEEPSLNWVNEAVEKKKTMSSACGNNFPRMDAPGIMMLELGEFYIFLWWRGDVTDDQHSISWQWVCQWRYPMVMFMSKRINHQNWGYSMFNQPHIKMEIKAFNGSILSQGPTVQLSVDHWDASIGRSWVQKKHHFKKLVNGHESSKLNGLCSIAAILNNQRVVWNGWK